MLVNDNMVIKILMKLPSPCLNTARHKIHEHVKLKSAEC